MDRDAHRPRFVVFVTMSLWDEPHRGRHHLARALSERHRVLWVNRRSWWNEAGRSRRGVEIIDHNLSVLHTGRSKLPWRVDERINWNNRRRLRQLWRILDDLGVPDLVWITDYKAAPFADAFQGVAPSLYFCNDLFRSRLLEHHESRLAATVDHVFATDPKLVQRLQRHNRNATFIPHGVWPSDRGPEFHEKPAPVTAGYVGTIRSGVDHRFLQAIVEQTDLRLILAGPIIECREEDRRAFQALFQHARVEYRGPLEPAEARATIGELDIGLLPYETRVNGFAIKFFDYLAEGLPIVATDYFDWPEPFDRFVQVHRPGVDLHGFLQAVHDRWDRAEFEAALALARRSTWHDRLKQVGKVVGLAL